jgi:hypothetical protein
VPPQIDENKSWPHGPLRLTIFRRNPAFFRENIKLFGVFQDAPD